MWKAGAGQPAWLSVPTHTVIDELFPNAWMFSEISWEIFRKTGGIMKILGETVFDAYHKRERNQWQDRKHSIMSHTRDNTRWVPFDPFRNIDVMASVAWKSCQMLLMRYPISPVGAEVETPLRGLHFAGKAVVRRSIKKFCCLTEKSFRNGCVNVRLNYNFFWNSLQTNTDTNRRWWERAREGQRTAFTNKFGRWKGGGLDQYLKSWRHYHTYPQGTAMISDVLVVYREQRYQRWQVIV